METPQSGSLKQVLLLALVVATFGSTLGGTFAFDDRFIVLDNPKVSEPSQWHRFFFESAWSDRGDIANNYRPLPLVTYGVNYLIGGWRPFDFHLVNLLLHAVSVLLVFRIGVQLGLSRISSWLAAAIFAAHPIQTEPVAAIVGRMDLMAGAGLLGALSCHIKWRQQAAAGELFNGWSVLAIALYCIALLSKEHVFLFPLIAVAYDLTQRTRLWPRSSWLYSAYGIAAVAYLFVRFMVFEGQMVKEKIHFVSNPLASVDGPLRFVSALKVAGLYLGNFFYPIRLSPDYCFSQILPLESISDLTSLAVLSIFGIAVTMASLIAIRVRRAAVPLALTVATFLPVSNLLIPIGTVMADRLFYLPVAGLAVLIGVAVDRGKASMARLTWFGGVVVVLVLASLSFRQSLIWRDNFSLDSHSVEVAPMCTRAHSNLGHDYLDREMTDRAEESFVRSLDLYSDYLPARAGLARVAFLRGQWNRALETADGVLQQDPGHLGMLDLAARSWQQLGRSENARKYWLGLLEIDPDHSETMSNLAILAWEDGYHLQALELWNEAAKQPNASVEIWYNLAQAYERIGGKGEAMEAYLRFLSDATESNELVTSARRRVEALSESP